MLPVQGMEEEYKSTSLQGNMAPCQPDFKYLGFIEYLTPETTADLEYLTPETTADLFLQ